MSSLLRLLIAFLTLGADPPEGADPTGGTPSSTPDAAAAGGGDDTSLDDLLDLGEGGSQAEPTSAGAGGDRSGSDLETIRRELAEERRLRQAAEDRARSTPPPAAAPARDPEYEREEQQLRDAQQQGFSEEQMRWLRWQIGQQRDNRAARSEARQALTASQDTLDRTEFSKLEITKPQIFKRYAERVEQVAADFRAKGNPAPRMLILRMLLGEDMMNGKVAAKPKSTPASGGATATPSTQVPRGRTPNIRSDVGRQPAKNTESEARRRRLENQII